MIQQIDWPTWVAFAIWIGYVGHEVGLAIFAAIERHIEGSTAP